jgi:hypothetical protein
MRPLLCVLFFATAAAAQEDTSLPSLSIREGNQSRNLDITFLGIDVDCHGHLAEVTYEVEFLNTTRRNQEGEFSLPLPDGATISRYALEVNGEMRPAVSVEKERALNAYETIKRRGVDPGIVEKMENNVYRTRIFPILPKSTKRVRIGYIRRLPNNGTFTQTWKHSEKVGTFDVKIRGAKVTKSVGPGEKNLEKTNPFSFTSTDKIPFLKLTIQSEVGGVRTDVSRGENGDRHFLVQGPAPPKREPDTTGWKRVRLIWDSSRSRVNDDHKSELASLKNLWTRLGNVEVVFHVLRNSLEEPRTFTVKDGKSPDLENAISSVIYDGAADFSQIEHSAAPTILVTDGKVSSPAFAAISPSDKAPSVLLTPDSSKPERRFFQSGYSHHPAAEEGWSDAIFARESNFRVIGISPKHWTVSTHGGRFYLSGLLPADHTGEITIHTGDARTLAIPAATNTDEWSFTRRFHAQQRLGDLEKTASEEEILAHAMSERLASDLSSLIVLELFDDHLRFEIPPPEPELLERYQTELSQRHDRVRSWTKQGWERKRTRFRTEFPWIDTELKSEIRTVAIWLDSSRAVFPEKIRNEAELKPYEEWLTQANAVVKRKDEHVEKQSVTDWKVELDNQVAELALIRKQPPVQPENNEIPVSVRGFVKHRKVVSAEVPFHLTDAIDEAGGPNHYGSLTRVFLYRNAARTGLNLKSTRYEPRTLQWGDMIVVESEPINTSGWGDPFADPFIEATTAGGGTASPAVFEVTGTSKAKPQTGRPFLGKAEPFLSNSVVESQGLKATASVNDPVSRGLDKNVIDAFSDDRPASKIYEELLSESMSQDLSLATAIEVSRILFKKKESELGTQCLSNILELQDNPVEASRSYVYWLYEFGQQNQARDFLADIIAQSPDDATTALLKHDSGRLQGQPESFRDCATHSLKKNKSHNLGFISLVDWFASAKDATFEDLRNDPLQSDLRLVVVTSGSRLNIELKEPAKATKVGDSGTVRSRSDRTSEFLIRRAWPGRYLVQGNRWENNIVPMTAHVVFYTNWGRENQTEKRKTILIDSRRFSLGEIRFSWED